MLMFSSLGDQKQTTSVYWILGFQREQSVLFLSLLPNQDNYSIYNSVIIKQKS